MKVGTDGVLLGAWAKVENAKTILDVGTGTGLIALMLAQRSGALITGIDIDKNAIAQATENVKISPWPKRISLVEGSFQNYSENCKQLFDLIISNPPYFQNSLLSPVENRTVARHTSSLTHQEFIDNAIHCLSSTGRICVILPVNEGLQCAEYALQSGLYCAKKISVIPKPNAQPKRLLLEFSFQKTVTFESELVIESEIRHQYSADFTALVKDFYLKL